MQHERRNGTVDTAAHRNQDLSFTAHSSIIEGQSYEKGGRFPLMTPGPIPPAKSGVSSGKLPPRKTLKSCKLPSYFHKNLRL
jgi:hypothetical protein